MQPPPFTPTFDDLPADIGNLFRRSFERGSENGRPSSHEWLAALKMLEAKLVKCPADDGHQHAGHACVWCRIASIGGPEYFYGAGGSGGTFQIDDARLQAIIRQLDGMPPQEFAFDLRQHRPAVLPVPTPLPDGIRDERFMDITLRIAVGFSVLLLLFGGFMGGRIVVGTGLIGALVMGVWWLLWRGFSQQQQERRRREQELRRCRDTVEHLEQEWGQVVDTYRRAHDNCSRRITQAVREARGHAMQFQAALNQLSVSAEAAARRRHLTLHTIVNAAIPGIGTGRKLSLLAAGIVSAADINPRHILSIEGFGDALTARMVQWRDECLRGFRFDPHQGVAAGDLRVLVKDFQSRHASVIAGIQNHFLDIQRAEQRCRDTVKRLTTLLNDAVPLWYQAEADLRMMK